MNGCECERRNLKSKLLTHVEQLSDEKGTDGFMRQV